MADNAGSERRSEGVKPASIVDAAVVVAILADAWSLRPVETWPFLSPEQVFLIAAGHGSVSPEEAFAVAVSHLALLVEQGDFRPDSIQKAGQIDARFIAYVRKRFQIDDVRLIGRTEAIAFVHAATLGKETRPPADRTKDNRRWALALLFRTLRSLDLYDGDPLLDVVPFPRPRNSARPLLDWELRRCERYARSSAVNDTLGPTLLALAEATATTSETPQVLVADVHPDGRRVWLGAETRGTARWGLLTEWGSRAVRARLGVVQANGADTPLAYGGRGTIDVGQANTCMGLRRILDTASLGDDSRIQPRSIRAWAGRRIWDETGDIEEVRHRLGLKVLDDARRLIEVPWGRCDIPPPHRAPSRESSP